MRADLPSGTVTFLFTDVDGSTAILHELGAAHYGEALAEHRRTLSADSNGSRKVMVTGNSPYESAGMCGERATNR